MFKNKNTWIFMAINIKDINFNNMHNLPLFLGGEDEDSPVISAASLALSSPTFSSVHDGLQSRQVAQLPLSLDAASTAASLQFLLQRNAVAAAPSVDTLSAAASLQFLLQSHAAAAPAAAPSAANGADSGDSLLPNGCIVQ